MNKIFNVRVKRLIKDGLLDCGKELLFVLGLFIIVAMITIVLNGEMLNSFKVVSINSGEFTIGNVINSNLFTICVIVMLIVGIAAGVELPQYVRIGFARNEYFISKTVVAVIVSLLIAPIMLTLNIIFNLIVTSESSFYNALYIGDGEIFTLITQFLIYIALFLLGFCLIVIWQRVNWRIGIILGIIGYIGWKIGRWFDIFTVITGDAFFEISWSFSGGSSVGMAMTIILISGIGTYYLIRGVSMKIK